MLIPCAARGVIELLDASNITIEGEPCINCGLIIHDVNYHICSYDIVLGKHVVVIGRSNLVGKPVAQLLLRYHL